MPTMTEPWTRVEEALPAAKAIAWDGCHKVYVLLDDESAREQEGWGYRENDVEGGSRMFYAGEVDLLDTLRDWWDQSCPLRFVNSITSDPHVPNSGYVSLIGQGELDEDDPEDEDDEYGEDEDDDEDGEV